MMKNINQLMKQAQEMQKKMTAAQEELENKEVQGQSGGGLVKVTMNGRGELKSLSIDPSLLDPKEVEVLEDLVVAACNDGKNKATTMMNDEMAKITGGLNLPGGMGLPF